LVGKKIPTNVFGLAPPLMVITQNEMERAHPPRGQYEQALLGQVLLPVATLGLVGIGEAIGPPEQIPQCNQAVLAQENAAGL